MHICANLRQILTSKFFHYQLTLPAKLEQWFFRHRDSWQLTCRIFCMGHLTITCSSHSSLASVSRSHRQTRDDCSYCDSSKSAQFFISSFSLAWTNVSNKNDVPGSKVRAWFSVRVLSLCGVWLELECCDWVEFVSFLSYGFVEVLLNLSVEFVLSLSSVCVEIELSFSWVCVEFQYRVCVVFECWVWVEFVLRLRLCWVQLLRSNKTEYKIFVTLSQVVKKVRFLY